MAKRGKLTRNAKAFMSQNARFGVVEGSAVRQGGEGAKYRLSNGQTFTLSGPECRAVGEVYWHGLSMPSEAGAV